MSCLGKVGVVDEKHDSKQVLWEIKDFLSLSADVGKYYESNTFPFEGEKWCLRIYPGGDDKEASGHFSVYLQKILTPKTECTIHFTLDLKKADGSLLNSHAGSRHSFKRLGHGYRKFFQRSKLLELQADLMPSDVLTVVCTMRLGHPLPVASPTIDTEFSELDKLSESFKGLLLHKESCDVTLVVRGVPFQVHKAVLIARSSVFSGMFEHEMSESETGTVDIPDCDEKSFGIFLKYLYSGKATDVPFQSALHLYQTADKYGVEELKAYCLQCLKKYLTVEDVLDAVILADVYDEAELMASAQDFFISNAYEILSTKQRETLNKQNFLLATKLLKSYFSCQTNAKTIHLHCDFK